MPQCGTCTVCLCAVDEADAYRTPCGHVFHRECIKQYQMHGILSCLSEGDMRTLASSNEHPAERCPNCRASIGNVLKSEETNFHLETRYVEIEGLLDLYHVRYPRRDRYDALKFAQECLVASEKTNEYPGFIDAYERARDDFINTRCFTLHDEQYRSLKMTMLKAMLRLFELHLQHKWSQRHIEEALTRWTSKGTWSAPPLNGDACCRCERGLEGNAPRGPSGRL